MSTTTEAAPNRAAIFELIDINRLAPSPTNPRKRFDEQRIAELADSIRQHGILEPLIVRGNDELTGYEIVAGERRYRAALLAEQTSVPCILRELSARDVLEIQVIENNQRQDLDPIEEAEGLAKLIDTGIYGTGEAAVKELAGKLGRSIRYVYNRLKLQDISDEARQLVWEGRISVSHAELLSRFSPATQADIIQGSLFDYHGNALSVRQVADRIRRVVLRMVDSFPFPTTDPDLLQTAGPCSTCPKNTKNAPEAFPDMPDAAKGMCSDPACYEAKMEAFLAVKQAAVEAEHGIKPVLVASGYHDDHKGALSTSSYNEVKSDNKDAKLALVVSGPDTGRVIHIKPTASHSGRGAKHVKSPHELEAERKAREDRHYRRAVLAATGEELIGSNYLLSTAIELVLREVVVNAIHRGGLDSRRAIATSYGLTFNPKGADCNRALRERAEASQGAKLIDLLLRLEYIEVVEYGYGPRLGELETIANEVGIDLDLLKREAAEAHPIRNLKGKHENLKDAPIPELTKAEAEQLASDVAEEIDEQPAKKPAKGKGKK